MKKSIHYVIAAGVALAMSALETPGQQDQSGVYLEGNVGAAFSQGVTVRAGTRAMDTSLKPGIRADLGVGWRLSDGMAIELQSGLIWNSVGTVGGTNLSSVGVGADLYAIPLMANLVFGRVPEANKLAFRFGGGVGGIATVVNAHGSAISGSDTDFAFAYQALAGWTYRFGEHVEAGLAYEFLGTTDHHWTIQNTGFRTTALLSHSVLVTASWKF